MFTYLICIGLFLSVHISHRSLHWVILNVFFTFAEISKYFNKSDFIYFINLWLRISTLKNRYYMPNKIYFKFHFSKTCILLKATISTFFCDKNIVYYILILIFEQNTRIFSWYFKLEYQFFFLLALALIFHVPFHILLFMSLNKTFSELFMLIYKWCKKTINNLAYSE